MVKKARTSSSPGREAETAYRDLGDQVVAGEKKGRWRRHRAERKSGVTRCLTEKTGGRSCEIRALEADRPKKSSRCFSRAEEKKNWVNFFLCERKGYSSPAASCSIAAREGKRGGAQAPATFTNREKEGRRKKG